MNLQKYIKLSTYCGMALNLKSKKIEDDEIAKTLSQDKKALESSITCGIIF